MVVAGVSLRKSQLAVLSELGVRDSKLLTASMRERLYKEIRRLAKRVSVRIVSPKEIDEYVITGTKYRKLNFLEAKAMASVIDKLRASTVYVDTPDVDLDRFRTNIEKFIKTRANVVCRHKEDVRNPVVSAASIVAKVERDSAVSKLRRLHGDFGSGYPSDPRTRDFVRGWLTRAVEDEHFVRRSWATVSHLSSLTLESFW